MAVSDNPQIQVLVDTVEGIPYGKKPTEQTPFLRTNQRRLKFKCKKRCCIQSKAALLILCWNLLLTLFITAFLDPNFFISLGDYEPDLTVILAPIIFSSLAFLYLFYPLAGCLADIRCGRYKTTIRSLWLIFVSGILLLLLAAIAIVLLSRNIYGKYSHSVLYELIAPPFLIFFLICLSALLVTLCFSYISFSANIIQFGMDQLHDSPSEDSVFFIHWFVFTSYAGSAVFKIMYTGTFTVDALDSIPYYSLSSIITISLVTVNVIFLGVSLCVARRKRQWFMIDSGSRNPYKLVYKVIKFAAQHKTPIRRSAFTYCEDELPSRMDLGKEKYGGPFTTEQVEDIKAFLGILRLLVTIGPVFTTDIAINSMLPAMSLHLEHNTSSYNQFYLYFSGFNGFPDVTITILIPIYIYLLRPFIYRYIPGMLKRIGLGMTLLLLSSISTLLIDTIGHLHRSNKFCFLSTDYSSYHTDKIDGLNINVQFLSFPYILNALGYTFFYIASYEFICAQSPHAMKGLLIGMFFTVKGVFQLIGATVVLIPFISWDFNTSFPSCGFVYYLINILVGLIGLVAYTWVARRYQYRQRDEPDNIYRYAEEYYDRDQDELESTYDYSNDCDNLNVRTIN